MSNVIRPLGTPRVEVWDKLASDGGTRLCFVKEPLSLVTVESLEGAESLAMQIAGTAPTAAFVAENRVVRLWRSDSDYEEWPITGAITAKRDKGNRIDVLGQPTLYRLGTCGLVSEYDPASSNGLIQLDVGVSQLTIEEILQKYVIDHPVISAQLPWLTMGTMDFDDILIDLQWNAATPLQVARAGVAEIQKQLLPGQLAELAPLRRISNTSYAIDVVAGVGMARARVSLTLGRNLTSLEEKNDPTDRASQLMAVCQAIGGFPTFLGGARFKASATNSGAKTLVTNDPAGCAGAIGFDDQLIGWYLYREKTGETALITDSVASTQTLTLSTWPSGLANGEYFQFRINEPATGLLGSGNGLQPYYLEHPIYAATTAPGIGVKLRTLDRTDVASVANMVPNAIMRQWSNHAALPDGYTFSVNAWGSPAVAPSAGFGTFAYNNDPLFTKRGQSTFFSILFGTIVSPPFAFTPVRANQRASVIQQLYLTSGWDAAHKNAEITLRLGVMLADGTVKPWFDADRTGRWQPTSFRPADTWKPLAANAWDTIGIQGVDLTTESATEVNNYPPAAMRVQQADLDALPVDALGLVWILNLSADGTLGARPIEGYFDGAMFTITDEAAPEISEFGRANAVWQDVNVNLNDLAPPQKSYPVSMIDLYRMNPTLTEEQVGLGGPTLLNARDMGIVNVNTKRFTEVRKNHLVPGDIQVVLGSTKRKITTLVSRGSAGSVSGTGAGGGTTPGGTSNCGCGGTGPVTTGGGTSGPTILLTLDSLIADVPTIKATVSPGVVAVKFSTDPSAFPDLTTTQGETVDTTTPFTLVGSAMTPGDSLYVSALAYDNNGVESALATLLVEDPIGFTEPGTGQTMPVDFTEPGDGGATTSKNRWDFVNTMAAANVYNVVGGIEGNGSPEEHDVGSRPPYWQYDSTAPQIAAHSSDFYVVARFDLKGQTVASETPLIQAYFTQFAFTITPSRKVKLYVDDGANGFTLLGESAAAVIPATGFCRIDLRARSSNSGAGFCWVRVSDDPAVAGALVEMVPDVGGSNVHFFSGLTFWWSGSPNGSVINSIAIGTGLSDGDFGLTLGAVIDGVQWDNIYSLDPSGFGDYDWADNA